MGQSNVEICSELTNYIFDHLVTNNGSLNYCLVVYDCWPFDDIDVKVVGFAVTDSSLLDWSDDSLGTIYEGSVDADGVPQCLDECYKHQDFAANADTSACSGAPFDMSLWPTLGLGGGAGGDWGSAWTLKHAGEHRQRPATGCCSRDRPWVGLPDFYQTTDKPADYFPVCIMDAGTSATITPADGWMLRRVLEHIKSRYSF
ncbi:unnamed protein product [Phytophthora lilii]|uniref:Unnamed protein product n=1 Tax=Phytophthora lilii TaxID=2077276 RepID=A0A9W6WZA1_9STRA|nr:unnamed protein product [Phytophthora lilii]